jgi:biotin-dependent carboxylase-like uncharacterized protein
VALIVVSPGLCATVQDLGRPGYREWGVPVAGAFDRGSYALANALLGNEAGAAAVELTLVGGVYEAEVALGIALAGATMEATIERPDGSRHALSVPQTVSLKPGDRLALGSTLRGARCYLAVKGGWQTPRVLGSRSSEVRLQPGEILPAEPSTTLVRRLVESPFPGLEDEPVRIVDGPDARRGFDPRIWESRTFRVGSQSDRMGLRLEGDPLAVKAEPERVSMPVAPGAVQVAGGQLISLGVSCGTMGGYPHVAQVISADLDRLGQARPGDLLFFQRIDLREARQRDRDSRRERSARLLRTAAIAGDLAEN